MTCTAAYYKNLDKSLNHKSLNPDVNDQDSLQSRGNIIIYDLIKMTHHKHLQFKEDFISLIAVVGQQKKYLVGTVGQKSDSLYVWSI